MKSLIYFMTVYTLPSIWVNSLVVTKLDMNSFISYYQSEIMEHNVEEIMEFISKTDLFNYCDQLRQAKLAKATNSPTEYLEGTCVKTYVFPTETLILERDQTQMQLFNFRLGNSKQTVTFWGFPCMNYDKNMSWIVSPTFVPDAAFLFEFELNFRQLSQREINEETKVIAHSVAFVDQDGNVMHESIREKFLNIKRKLNERDPLCDLHPVLKYRLCSLALNVANPSYQSVVDFQTNNITYREYKVKEYKHYFNLDNYEDGCTAIKLLFPNRGSILGFSTYRQMLYCTAQKRSGMHIFIGLDPFDSTKIIYSTGYPYSESQWTSAFNLGILIPLLRHINVDKYNSKGL